MPDDNLFTYRLAPRPNVALDEIERVVGEHRKLCCSEKTPLINESCLLGGSSEKVRVWRKRGNYSRQ